MHTDQDFKAHQRAMWAGGDYHAFATASLWDFGPLLVEATGIAPGQRVLDVAAGTGNVAIRAAEAGADVIASDLTPENFSAGRREAEAHGVEIEWVEADAEALPFDDDAFDVVTSSVGAIFAPHHQAVADELLRVCRPGGTIGMIAIVPDGAVIDMFDIITRYAKESVLGEQTPIEWGREEHVRELFGDRAELTFKRRSFNPSPLADVDLFKRYHPVVRMLYAELADEPERIDALNRDLDAMAARWHDDAQRVLVIVARKRG
ncbi:class I SAM-dependent methyltransferase [Candidatus Solirubrobacter pratensis]|uniref:class I SAM-dependent methyltransferase n=1 Tax=Candidatus Solirubrobacter pratensis TaxID=1298857 RepID=UPI00068496FF|nr:methyltransferase domain-containing protein [Candidatus Solirubrobacter pratensis]